MRRDAKAWLARETRRFDVIFLDPPFADDPWSWLLPACEARLAPGGFVYAESPRELVPPAPFAVFAACEGRAGALSSAAPLMRIRAHQ